MKTCAKRDGFGLIEVMVAIAVIAGAALLVSQFVTNQTKQQVQIRSSSQCEAGLAAIINKIKEVDNNTQILSWLPSADPNNAVPTQVTREIATGYSTGTLGQVTAVVVPSMNETGFAGQGSDLASNSFNYQLISSASIFLAPYYPSYCAPAEVTSTTDYLGSMIEDMIDRSLTTIRAKVNLVNLSTGADEACGESAWTAIPVNRSVNANTNTNQGIRLTLTAEYQDPNGQTRSCSASSVFSPGSDLNPPSVTSTLSVVGLAPADIDGDGVPDVFCGSGGSASLNVSVSQDTNPEPGVLYFCKLDYHAGMGGNVDRTSGTSWFLCSMPEASINAVNVAVSPNPARYLSAGTVNVTQGENSRVEFQIQNAAEGTYVLHTKTVDVARNESVVRSHTVRIDLTRPQFRTSPAYDYPTYVADGASGLSTYKFQCSDMGHNTWATHLTPGTTVTTEWQEHHYYNGSTLSNSINCSRANATSSTVYSRFEAGQMNPGNTAWLDDGPKTAEFVACDVCSRVLNDPNPSRGQALWFLETVDTDTVGTSVNLNLSAIFSYDAGDNSLNPYILTYNQLSVSSLPSSTSTVTNPPRVRNAYSGRNITPGPLTFTASQANIAACEPYGTYQYSILNGCGRAVAPVLSRYTSARTSIGASPGHGIPFNTNYCPTFVNTKINTAPALNTNFIAGACASIGANYVDCTTDMVGGYKGQRTTEPSCTFYPQVNRSCKFRPCSAAHGLPAWVGTLEVGSSVTAQTPSPTTCGAGCGSTTITCSWNAMTQTPVVSGSGVPVGSCVPAPACPTCTGGTIECTSATQYPDCTQESTSPPLYCRPGSYTCPASTTSCTGCSNGDSQAVSPSCYDVDPSSTVTCCGPSSVPTCPIGMVECSTPGSNGCPATANADGLYCASPTCTNTPYNWEWPSGRPTDGSCVASCTGTQSVQNTYTQFCQGSAGEESGCCTGSPQSCRTCTDAPVAGQCGIGVGQSYVNPPHLSHHLCSAGAPTAVTQSGDQWNWRCTGSNSPSNDSGLCVAGVRANGVCGTTGTVSSMPTNLCSVGVASPSNLSGSSPWSWSCNGPNGGTTASCSAEIAVPAACENDEVEYSPRPFTYYNYSNTICGVGGISECASCPYYSGCRQVGVKICAKNANPGTGWVQVTDCQNPINASYCGPGSPQNNQPLPSCTPALFLSLWMCKCGTDEVTYECQ